MEKVLLLVKLLKITGLIKSLKEKIESGLPTWGTCAV
ncbi:glutamine amidotransferase PdxT [Clostridium beijerinckii]|nr:glutamine amidotransferase PdxT [Clostridium beijerinckii]